MWKLILSAVNDSKSGGNYSCDVIVHVDSEDDCIENFLAQSLAHHDQGKMAIDMVIIINVFVTCGVLMYSCNVGLHLCVNTSFIIIIVITVIVTSCHLDDC